MTLYSQGAIHVRPFMLVITTNRRLFPRPQRSHPKPGGIFRMLLHLAQSVWATVLEGTCLYLRKPMAPLKCHVPRQTLLCPASQRQALPQHFSWNSLQPSVPAPGQVLNTPREGKSHSPCPLGASSFMTEIDLKQIVPGENTLMSWEETEEFSREKNCQRRDQHVQRP